MVIMTELAGVNWDEIEATAFLPSNEASEPTISAEPVRSVFPVVPIEPVPFVNEWPEPSRHLMDPETPPAPPLDLGHLLPPRIAKWTQATASQKGCPPDYVLAGLLAGAASAIGNSRWVSPWRGWKEPPALWFIAIGNPSAGKSPGLDAALAPIRKIEAEMRKTAAEEFQVWAEQSEFAKVSEKKWKVELGAAADEGRSPPPKPETAKLGPQPHVPRLLVNDSTTEQLGCVHAAQPRGILQLRDELSGWLGGMNRYTEGSDRAFWLEAFGGRTWTVDRISRESVTIERLTICVVGGIQPDKLSSLMMKSGDDDGLLARFIPVFPEPVPISGVRLETDDDFIESVYRNLFDLQMAETEQGGLEPFQVHLTEEARQSVNIWRQWVRDRENENEGLLVSWLGKLPGMALRLSLVLAALDCAEREETLINVTKDQFHRATQWLAGYALPMVRRAYGIGGLDAQERAAVKLVDVIRDAGWEAFRTTDLYPMKLKGLRKAAELNPVLNLLEEHGIIRQVEQPVKTTGGRPARQFVVSPKIPL